ncbi:MAG: response regulator, partial [Chloroflexota bacterium]
PDFSSINIPQQIARILIIDNDKQMLDLSTTALKEAGWQVYSYAYTEIDLALVVQHHPDLIILDFELEDEGVGWEFLQALKMDDTTAKIPIIITTAGFQLPTELRDYLSIRYISIVHKPLDFDSFFVLIRKTLEEASQAATLFSGDRTLPILVVDDNEDMREATTSILRLEGYRVITAYNGLVTLDTISHADCCLILLDLDMPIMNGYEFLIAYDRQLRPHIPVVVLSAEPNIDFHALPNFVVDVLPKPFFLKRLLELVGRYARTV